MNDFTIYTAADVELIGSIFNFLAVYLGSGDFFQLARIGGVLGVSMIMIKSIMMDQGRSLQMGEMVIAIVLFLVMFGPTGTAVLVDREADERVVDNVPYGVLVPAWVITNIGREINIAIEDGVGLTSGAARMSENGFLGPLRVQIGLWESAYNGEYFSFIDQDIECSGGIGTCDPGTVDSEQTLVNYFESCTLRRQQVEDDTSIKTFITESTNLRDEFFFDSENDTFVSLLNNSGPEQLSCAEGRTPITTDIFDRLFGGTSDDLDAKIAEDIGSTNDEDTGAADWEADVTAANLAVGASVEDGQEMLQKALLTGVSRQAVMSKYGGDSATTQISTQLGRDSAIYGQMVAGVQSAGMLLEGRGKGSQGLWYNLEEFLEAAHYILTPVLGFFLVIGGIGIQAFAKFLLIPIWLQMTQILMTILNIWTISRLEDRIEEFGLNEVGAAQMSLDKMWQYTLSVSDLVVSASSLAGSLPMISLIFLTGSLFAVTQLSRGADANAAEVGNSAASAVPQGGSVAGMGGMVSNMASVTNGDIMGNRLTGADSTTASTGAMAQSTMQDAQRASEAARSSLGYSAANIFSESNGISLDTSTAASLVDSESGSQTSAASTAQTQSANLASEYGLSQQQASQLQAGLGMGIGAGEMLSMTGNFGGQVSESESDAFKKAYGESSQVVASETDSAQYQQALASQLQEQMAASSTQSVSEQDQQQLQDSLERSNSVEQSYERADSLANSSAVNTDIPVSALADDAPEMRRIAENAGLQSEVNDLANRLQEVKGFGEAESQAQAAAQVVMEQGSLEDRVDMLEAIYGYDGAAAGAGDVPTREEMSTSQEDVNDAVNGAKVQGVNDDQLQSWNEAVELMSSSNDLKASDFGKEHLQSMLQQGGDMLDEVRGQQAEALISAFENDGLGQGATSISEIMNSFELSEARDFTSINSEGLSSEQELKARAQEIREQADQIEGLSPEERSLVGDALVSNFYDEAIDIAQTGSSAGATGMGDISESLGRTEAINTLTELRNEAQSSYATSYNDVQQEHGRGTANAVVANAMTQGADNFGGSAVGAALIGLQR